MEVKLPRKFVAFCAFACLGITTEIFWTAGWDAVNSLSEGTAINLKLEGKSYVWMFPIYGSAAIFIPMFIKHIIKFPLIARLFIYAIGIFIVEFITGWLLDITTGQCPWHYESKLSVLGYIHLGYTPSWMLFGILLESLHKFFAGLQSEYVRG